MLSGKVRNCSENGLHSKQSLRSSCMKFACSRHAYTASHWVFQLHPQSKNMNKIQVDVIFHIKSIHMSVHAKNFSIILNPLFPTNILQCLWICSFVASSIHPVNVRSIAFTLRVIWDTLNQSISLLYFSEFKNQYCGQIDKKKFFLMTSIILITQ